MADETIITPPADTSQERSRAEERISQLSDKTRQAEEAKTAAEAKAAEALKKAEFAEGYADFVASNPAAKEFKQQIEEKFKAGIPVEDAAFAVLGKAGKLGAASVPVTPTEPAGGSAATVLVEPTKEPSKMSQEERREALSKDLIWS